MESSEENNYSTLKCLNLAWYKGHRDVPGTNYPRAMISSLTTVVVNTCLTIPQNVKPK
jgi:hypothetical protein